MQPTACAQTSHPLAATAALDILKSGGNAVDAAIAGAVLLGICEPQMTGLGGDMFALIQKDPSADVVALNGSGRAPRAANATALRAKGLSTIPLHSAEAITVPGAVDGFLPHGRGFREPKFGATYWPPAIHYARTGVPVAPRVAFDWDLSAALLQGTARDKFPIAGAAPKVGQLFASPLPSRRARVHHGQWPRRLFTPEQSPKIWSPAFKPLVAATTWKILQQPKPPMALLCAAATKG